MKFRDLSFILLLLSICSCRKKEKTVEVPGDTVYVHDTIKNAWQEEPTSATSFRKAVVTLIRDSKYLSVVDNIGGHYVYDTVTKEVGYYSQPSVGIYSDCNATVGKNYFIFPFSKCFLVDRLSWVDNIPTPYPARVFQFKDLDTAFITLEKYDGYPGQRGALINDSNYVYFPVYTSDAQNATIYKLKISPRYTPTYGTNAATFDTSSFQKIKIPSANPGFLYASGKIGNKVFFQNDGITYRIDANNSYAPVCNTGAFLYSFFKSGNNYYAVDFMSQDLYFTSDLGESWTVAGSFIEKYFHVINLDDRIIAMRFGQLWELAPGNNATFQVRELVNSGLEHATIYDIARSDGKIYVATNAGLFSRKYSDFYQYK